MKFWPYLCRTRLLNGLQNAQCSPDIPATDREEECRICFGSLASHDLNTRCEGPLLLMPCRKKICVGKRCFLAYAGNTLQPRCLRSFSVLCMDNVPSRTYDYMVEYRRQQGSFSYDVTTLGVNGGPLVLAMLHSCTLLLQPSLLWRGAIANLLVWSLFLRPLRNVRF